MESSSSPIPICGERSSSRANAMTDEELLTLCADEASVEIQEPCPKKKRPPIRYMSDEELLEELDDEYEDMEITKEILQKLRDYFAELEDSQGFEIHSWPGYFFGMTSIVPAELSKEDKPEEYSKYERLAKFAMDEYNKNNQAEFVFEELVRANVHPQIYATCYLTFTARDGRVQDASLVTFRAVVVVYMGPGEKDISVSSCVPKDPS